jgi:hypothetical protein
MFPVEAFENTIGKFVAIRGWRRTVRLSKNGHVSRIFQKREPPVVVFPFLSVQGVVFGS